MSGVDGPLPGHILLLCKFNYCQNTEKDVQSRREKEKEAKRRRNSP